MTLTLPPALSVPAPHAARPRAPSGHYGDMAKPRTLNAWRKAIGLTVADLAEAAQITPVQVQPYLYRGNEPGVVVGVRLARALGVQPEEILWGVTEEEPVVPPMPAMVGGRVTDDQIRVAMKWADAGRTKAEIAEAIGISRQTLYKYLGDPPEQE